MRVSIEISDSSIKNAYDDELIDGKRDIKNIIINSLESYGVVVDLYEEFEG